MKWLTSIVIGALNSVLLIFTSSSAVLAAENNTNSRAPIEKTVSFALLEDYNKGDDLNEVARDFALMNELGIDVMRCSFGWDDYEPARGQYDFAWLRQFVALANCHGIKLRPYLAYTPRWAGVRGLDGIDWNNPPESYQAWYNFVYHLAFALREYPNVLSYEIYNEENDAFWWEGDAAQYSRTLRTAARAIRSADPTAQVILGGMVFPDADWLLSLLDDGDAPYYDVVPFHAYPETWENTTVEQYLDVQYHRYFVSENERQGGKKPIWINEMGYATTAGRSETEQAEWFTRAVSTFLADPYIEHLGFYEIKDLAHGNPALGGEANYHLGLTYADRSKKLAFRTVRMLSHLLNVGAITLIDDEAKVRVTGGAAGELYHHLFGRRDGAQVLFVYDKRLNPTLEIDLQRSGRVVRRYKLDGTFSVDSNFDGHMLHNVSLVAGKVAIFEVLP